MMSNYYDTPDVPSVDDGQGETATAQWLAELQAERLDNWRREAIEQYPQVAPLREYLTDDSKAKVLALAKDLAEKLGSGQTAPSVRGGSPALSGTRHPGDDTYDLEAAQEELRQTRNHDEVMTKFIRAKLDAAGVAPLYDN